MVQEDHNDYNRYKSSSPYNITNNAKIINMDLETNGFKTVGYVNQYKDQNADHVNRNQAGSSMFRSFSVMGHGFWMSRHTL